MEGVAASTAKQRNRGSKRSYGARRTVHAPDHDWTVGHRQQAVRLLLVENNQWPVTSKLCPATLDQHGQPQGHAQLLGRLQRFRYYMERRNAAGPELVPMGALGQDQRHGELLGHSAPGTHAKT